MSDLKFEDRLKQKLNDLPSEMQPQRELWQGIDIALTGQQSTVHQASSANKTENLLSSIADWFAFKPMALAASVTLVALLSWKQISLVDSTGQVPFLANEMMRQHEEQKLVLLTSLADTPELTSNWESQLSELEEAANAIKKALQNDPENIALLKMLQQVHQQQLQLIEAVHAPTWQAI